MPYSYTNSRGTAYLLHARHRTLKSGGSQTIYFFAREQREGALDSLPAGYQVAETANGLPVLKRQA